MNDRFKGDASAWFVARFGACVLDRERLELTRDGKVRALEPRPFALLVLLIEHRHRVLSKNDIAASCFGDDGVNDSAISRAVMKIRHAIGDRNADAPLIATERSIGYRFVGELQFGAPASDEITDVPAQGADAPAAQRVALLPFQNEVGDPGLAWVELGLMSLVVHALQSTPDFIMVPVQDVLTALGPMTTRTPIEHRVNAMETRLGVQATAWARLTGGVGRYVLHFDVKTPGLGLLHGVVTGGDVTLMALDVAAGLRRRLAPDARDMGWPSLDLGDAFLNQVFAMALQRSRQNRLIEAEHLFEVVQDAGATSPDLRYEAARVQVLLGRPDALVRIEAIEVDAERDRNLPLQALACSLRGAYLEQSERAAEAAQAMLKAAELAEGCRLHDLAVRSMLAAAAYLSAVFDERALAVLSQAIPRAERLGNRVILAEAYFTAAVLAGHRSDWVAASRHVSQALTLAEGMDAAMRFLSSTLHAWIQLHLGKLRDAGDIANAAFRVAAVSGKQPDLGLAAMTTWHAQLSSRQIRSAALLFRSVQAMSQAGSPALARFAEIYCRAPLLRITGHFDAALLCIDAVHQFVQHDPVGMAVCGRARLAVLLQARRFDEVSELCDVMQSAAPKAVDPRLLPWLERALAQRDCYGLGNVTAALERLHAAIRFMPVCEAHGVISLEAAWLHLEQGDAQAARRVVSDLPDWLEQSPSGAQVSARLRYADGDWGLAASLQRQFVHRYAESVTEFHRELLCIYEQSSQDGRARALPEVGEALDLHWRPTPEVIAELPALLGGTAP